LKLDSDLRIERELVNQSKKDWGKIEREDKLVYQRLILNSFRCCINRRQKWNIKAQLCTAKAKKKIGDEDYHSWHSFSLPVKWPRGSYLAGIHKTS